MRLWSIHPKYLDKQGLLAVWREGLLAKKVLDGKTKGYTNHPQLKRFKDSLKPKDSINLFLEEIWIEAKNRGYVFNNEKFEKVSDRFKIDVNDKQIEYEFKHLLNKLKNRDKKKYLELKNIKDIKTHPLFEKIPGEVEEWEIIKKLNIYPKIKFIVNPKEDIYNAYNFLKVEEDFKKNFFPLELQKLFKENKSILEQKKIIQEYTNEMYKVKKKDIEKGTIFIEEEWREKERCFYKLTNKIFKNHPWPKGEYIGYPSIYYMFPRYLNNKTFFYPYTSKNNLAIRIIGHEMLHFIFFDFIKKKYSKKELEKLNEIKEPKYIWKISEAFNTVIEHWEPYKREMGFKYNTEPYPECKKMFLKMKKQWLEESDIDILLNKWLKS